MINKEKLKNIIKYFCNADITKVVMVILCLLVLALAIVSFANVGKDGEVAIVLSFFGILATFIVVSNYSQVSDIKTDTNRQLIRQSFSQEEKNKEFLKRSNELEKILNEKIETMENDLNGKIVAAEDRMNQASQAVSGQIDAIAKMVMTEADEPLIPQLKVQFEELKTLNEQLNHKQEEMSFLMTYLLAGDHRDLLLTTLKGLHYRCSVVYAGKQCVADAFIRDEEMFFKVRGEGEKVDVESVNNKAYNMTMMKSLIQIFNNCKSPTSSLTTHNNVVA